MMKKISFLLLIVLLLICFSGSALALAKMTDREFAHLSDAT